MRGYYQEFGGFSSSLNNEYLFVFNQSNKISEYELFHNGNCPDNGKVTNYLNQCLIFYLTFFQFHHDISTENCCIQSSISTFSDDYKPSSSSALDCDPRSFSSEESQNVVLDNIVYYSLQKNQISSYSCSSIYHSAVLFFLMPGMVIYGDI